VRQLDLFFYKSATARLFSTEVRQLVYFPQKFANSFYFFEQVRLHGFPSKSAPIRFTVSKKSADTLCFVEKVHRHVVFSTKVRRLVLFFPKNAPTRWTFPIKCADSFYFVEKEPQCADTFFVSKKRADSFYLFQKVHRHVLMSKVHQLGFSPKVRLRELFFRKLRRLPTFLVCSVFGKQNALQMRRTQR